MNKEILLLKKRVLPILKQYSVEKAGLFGSTARGTTNKNSDIDIVVQLPMSVNLIQFMRLKLALEHALGKKVDLVEYETLKPIIKKRILGSINQRES